jgi:hypothetical protein
LRFDKGKGKKGQVGEGEEVGVFLFWITEIRTLMAVGVVSVTHFLFSW